MIRNMGLARITAVFLIAAASACLFPAAAHGFEVPNLIRVGLESNYGAVERVSIANREISLGYSTDIGRGQYGILTAASGFEVRVSDGRAVLYDGGSVAAVLESGDNIAGTDGFLDLGKRKYRGAVAFMVSGARLTAVNVLTIEEYLFSVVPAEMPQAWHPEALKAQAVASRTYSVTRMSAHSDQGYHFCDRVHCQSYTGAANEADSTTAAVAATAGVLAYYNGEPINAVYSSSNGGYSEASENIWTEAVPYLRAVADVFETSGMRWERSFTLSQIQSLLTTNIGTVTRVYIGKTAPSGRVQELVIEGTSGSHTLTKDGIRTFFSKSDDGMLESRNFVMQGASVTAASETKLFVVGASGVVQSALSDMYALSAGGIFTRLSAAVALSKDDSAVYEASAGVAFGGQSQGNMAVFTGRGWGHGVGMSQYGAKDMAEAGFDYIQILKFYYTGIEVG